MMTVETLAKKVFKTIDSIEYFAVVVCCIGIVVLVFFGVLSRFFFHYSIAWSEELARYMFLWGALFGGAASCRNAQHGGIPLVVDKLSATGQRIVEILVPLGMAVLLAVLAWQTSKSTMQAFMSGQVSSTTEMPVWIVNFIATTAFGLSVFRCVQGLFERAYRVDEIDLKD